MHGRNRLRLLSEPLEWGSLSSRVEPCLLVVTHIAAGQGLGRDTADAANEYAANTPSVRTRVTHPGPLPLWRLCHRPPSSEFRCHVMVRLQTARLGRRRRRPAASASAGRRARHLRGSESADVAKRPTLDVAIPQQFIVVLEQTRTGPLAPSSSLGGKSPATHRH